jgi:hypothetical protein
MSFYPGQTDYIEQLNALLAGGSISYATGTWTPTLIGATTAGSATYTAQSGKYTHIGNRVDFQCVVTISAHTGTGEFRINGLPVTSDNSMIVPLYCRISNAAFSGVIDAYINPNTTQIVIPQLQIASDPFSAVPLTLWVTGNYQG